MDDKAANQADDEKEKAVKADGSADTDSGGVEDNASKSEENNSAKDADKSKKGSKASSKKSKTSGKGAEESVKKSEESEQAPTGAEPTKVESKLTESESAESKTDEFKPAEAESAESKTESSQLTECEPTQPKSGESKAEEQAENPGASSNPTDQTSNGKQEAEESNKSRTADIPMPAGGKHTAGGKKNGQHAIPDLSIFDLSIGVFLLVILSQLVANSYVVYLARSYNDRVCKESIALASKAAFDGKDTRQVQLAAFGFWEHCASPGFFIEHPELTTFKDEIDPKAKLRVITICSTTRARVPMPFLVLDKSVMDTSNSGGIFPQFVFNSVYQYRLTNPKNIEGKFIRDSSGHLISRPPKPSAAKTKSPTGDQAKAGAAKASPAKAGPAKGDPVKGDPTKADPVKPDDKKAGAGKVKPDGK